MGMFDGLFSAVLGAFGQQDANDKNEDIASAQMGFQERMAATQYQRAVEDMTKAGINPMLVTKLGGNDSPGGASARMENVLGAGVNSGVAAAATRETVENLKKTGALTEAQTEATHAETVLKNSQAAVNAASITEKNQNVATGVQQMVHYTALVDRIAEENRLTRAQVETELARPDSVRARTWRDQIEADLRAMDQPRKENEMFAEGSFFKRNVSPYLLDVQRLTNSGLSAARGLGLRLPRR